MDNIQILGLILLSSILPLFYLYDLGETVL